jgi:single-strand DNA-binding protein
MNLNRVMIIGNMTRDPEVKTTPNGKNVASFAVATNYQWTDANGQKQAQTEYHNIVAWGKLADICGQYLNKGKKVYVEGRLQTREWEAQDGTKRNRTEIVCENMIMLDRAGAPAGSTGASAGSYSTGNYAPAMANANAGATPLKTVEVGGSDEIRVEDIPF